MLQSMLTEFPTYSKDVLHRLKYQLIWKSRYLITLTTSIDMSWTISSGHTTRKETNTHRRPWPDRKIQSFRHLLWFRYKYAVKTIDLIANFSNQTTCLLSLGVRRIQAGSQPWATTHRAECFPQLPFRKFTERSSGIDKYWQKSTDRMLARLF